MGHRLRNLLKDDLVLAPGVWDGLTAILAEKAGFSALCASGFAVSASLGLPDAELYTMTENLSSVRTIREGSELPLIADIDTGYGNAVNARRAAQRFAAAGVDAVFMEDQESPKRCPLAATTAPPLTDVETAVGKVRAVKDAVGDGMLLIARTDARGDEAIARAVRYAEAGADLIMPVTKTFDSAEEWSRCHEEVGVPLMATLTASAWTEREFTPAVMREIGVGLAILPTQLLMAVAGAAERTLNRLATGEDPVAVGSSEAAMSHHRFVEVIDMARVEQLQHDYLPATV